MQEKTKTWQWFYLLFVGTLPFPALFQLRLSTTTIQFSDLLFGIAALTWIFTLRDRKLRWNAFHTCLALYGVAVSLSALASTDLIASAVKLAGKFYLIGIAFFAFSFVDSYERLKNLVDTWLLATAVVLFFSLIGIALFYAGLKDPSINIVVHPIFGSLPPGNYPRIQGFFLYPAMLSNFLSISWMLALLSGCVGWLRPARLKILGSSLVPVILFTLTPGLGGIFLATGIFLRQRLRTIFPGAAKLALSLGLMCATGFIFVSLIAVFSYSPTGTKLPLVDGQILPSHRVIAWKSTFNTFVNNPLLGKGIGMPTAHAEYSDPSGQRQLLADAHNTYLSVLGETGIVGFLAFMAVICTVLASLAGWKVTGEKDKLTKFCLFIALLDAFFYQSLTGSYEDARHMWVLCGLVVGISQSVHHK